MRDRVAMPHLTMEVGFTDANWPDWGYSVTPLLQEIRRERRIELAGEGFRFGDLKRWKAGKLLNNVQTYVGNMFRVKTENSIRLSSIPTIRTQTAHTKQERAVHGTTRCICIRYRPENYSVTRTCCLKTRDGNN